MNRILKLRSCNSLMVERFRAGPRVDWVETASRVLIALLLVGAVMGGGALFLTAGPAQAERQEVQASIVADAQAPKIVRLNAVAVAVSSPRRVWVDPPPLPSVEQVQSPAAPEKPAQAPAEPAPKAASVVHTVSSGAPSMPMDCLPAGLRGVLKDVEARYGAVTMVSTTELHTDNHSRGSVRHKLHTACKAIDFKVKGDRKAVVAYLRSRLEVAGVNTYGNNGVIHMDYNKKRQVARR